MKFIKSLVSRKFIVAIIAVAYFITQGDVNAAVAVIIAYFGANVAESFNK